MRRVTIVATVLAVLSWAKLAQADAIVVGTLGTQVGTLDPPIVYMEQAIATGSLGSSSFTDAYVTITFVGDTSNVFWFGIFLNDVGTTTVNVDGIGTATFTSDSVGAFDNQTFAPPAAGIGDSLLGASILDTFNAAFGTYDLMTSIGPVSGPSFIRPDVTFKTDLGGFNLKSAGDSTFTATTVPEPFSIILLGTVMAGCIWLRKRAP